MASGDEPSGDGNGPDDPEATRQDALADTLVQHEERAEDSSRALERGAFVGRYLVLSLLGEGAMGEVYTAYDPELDRRVALKLVHSRAAGAAPQQELARKRLVREAKAMARLSHPNVVQVFDVGTHGEDVYIAMEYVDARTLDAWWNGRSYEETLSKLLDAARGLAAAHEAGIVHRDFKPTNVLVGSDGRARVIDFGIAEQEPRHGGADDEAGFKGLIVGTPGYMAPEQFEAGPVDPRTDQFSFCVTLYEALFDQRPFAGRTLLEIAAEVMAGNLREPPSNKAVPGVVRTALARGLSVDPAARFESMDALIDALSPRPSTLRQGVALGVAAAVVAGGATLLAIVAAPTPEPVCQGLDENLVGVWDDDRRQDAQDAITASGGAFANEIWQRVERALDERSEGWVEQRVEACEATRLRGEQTEELLGLRMACLDRRLAELDATVDVLVDADLEVVEKAAQIATDLPSLELCTDIDTLRAEAAHEPPPDQRGAVNAVIDSLANARALHEAGRYEQAFEVISQALREAREIGFEPTIARALVWSARVRQQRGQVERAEEDVFEAIRLADHSQALTTEAEAWTMLVYITRQRGEAGRAERWLAHAESALDAAGNPPILAATLEVYRGLVYRSLERNEQALAAFDRALAHFREELGSNHFRVGSVLSQRASVLSTSGDYEAALSAYEAAIDTLEMALGEGHPRLGSTLSNYANALRRARRFDDARATYERALTLKRETLGADHPSVAFTLINLGKLEQQLGRYDAAEPLFRQAIDIRRQRLGEAHPAYADALIFMSSLELARGNVDEAIEMRRRALALNEARGDAIRTARTKVRLSYALLVQGDAVSGGALAQEALSMFTDAGVDQSELDYPRAQIGFASLLQRKPEEAIEDLSFALEVRTERDVDLADLGFVQLGLGRALFESDRDPDRGRMLVEAARESYEQAGPSGRWGFEQARAWLEENPSVTAVD